MYEEKLKILRNHGAEPKYYHKIVGGNFRLDAMNAAVLRVKLRSLDKWTEARQKNAADYNRLFGEAGLAGNSVSLPKIKQARHIFNQYVIRIDRRDELREHLQRAGIGTEVYYPVPLQLQECFAYLGYRAGDLPESEAAAEQSLALPIFPELTMDQKEYVVSEIKRFLKGDSE